MVEGLIKLTAPIQREFEADEEWQAISSKAYPLLSGNSGPKSTVNMAQRKRDQNIVSLKQHGVVPTAQGQGSVERAAGDS